jgi:MFS family permease
MATRDFRGGSDVASPNLRTALSLLYGVRTFRITLLAFTIAGLTIGSVIAWNMRAFQSSFGMAQVEAGYLVAGAGAASLVGLLVYGILARHLRRKSAAAPLWLGAAMMVAGGVLGSAAFLSHGGTTLVTLFLLSQLFLSVFQASLFTTALEVAPPSLGASATALMGFFFALVGQGFGPFAIGVVVDLLEPGIGRSALSYTLAALTLAGGLAIAALMLRASNYLVDDLWDEGRSRFGTR